MEAEEKLLLILTSIVVGIVCVIVLFMNVYPVFGRKPSKEKAQAFSRSSQYVNGKFQNPVPTHDEYGLREYGGDLAGYCEKQS